MDATGNRRFFACGKLPPEVLKKQLEKLNISGPEVIIGPGIGVDAAAIQIGERVLVAKSDPITFTEAKIGWYAVHVNANDIACMGAKPRWFLATLLLPEKRSDEAMVETIFHDIHRACRQVGATLVGGHTEITPGLERPVVVGSMLGETSTKNLLDISRCRPGDCIILALGIAIEGTAIIAQVHEEKLAKIYDDEFIRRCQNFTEKPGISVLKPALEARKATGIRAMHDPTEGGLATALHELADASGCGLDIEEDQIPMLPESKLLCDQFGLDILGVIASGALIIVVEKDGKDAVLDRLQKKNILAAEIGVLTDEPEQRRILRDGEAFPLPRFDQDEIVKIL